MNILSKLTIKNLKLNKKRTTVAIIGIILSVALITSVSTMYSSLIKSLIEYETYEKGDFHVAFYDVPVKDINTFKNNRALQNIYTVKNIGYAKLSDSKNEYKPYAYIKEFSKESLNNLSVKLVQGRLPKNNSEIVIPTHLKTNGRVELKIGDTINLDIGSRVSDNHILDQDTPYTNDSNESIINTYKKEYKIVGIIERPATNIESFEAPGYTFISFNEDISLDSNVDIYVKFSKKYLNDIYKITAKILNIDDNILTKYYSSNILTNDEYQKYNNELEKSKYKINVNDYLIKLEVNPLSENTAGDMGFVVGIVCIIIVITSVFCIKNSFDISITEKTKQYGMLRSIGATKKQIKKNVFYEASILGIIAIPIGIIMGLFASYILIIVTNHFIKNSLSQGLKLYFSVNLIAIIVSIILGIITIYLSAIKSAIKASKVSPIESIKNSGEIKLKRKMLKTPKIINKILGIGGEISYKNLKRNKKKYRTTIISIIVSVSVFIALSTFMNLAFTTIDQELKKSEYNISLSANYDNEEQYNKILETTKLDNIENFTVYRNMPLQVNNPKFNNDYIKIMNIDKNNYDDYINVMTLGEVQYKKYIDKLGLDYNEVKDKGILIDKQKIGRLNDNKIKYYTTRIYDYSVNDKISLNIDNNIQEITIAYLTDIKPFGFKYNESTKLIISDEYYDKLNRNNNQIDIFYESNNPNKLQDNIDELLTNEIYTVNNIMEQVKTMENIYILIGIFLYGFIIVISLIGITNIFNTITTNMNLRKQEFAMLKSIGMTNKEFNRMISLESLFIGLKSLIFGIPIGVALSYLLFYVLGGESTITLKFPITAIIISIICVLLLITCIMKYSINKIRKQNIIETIRNENI